LFHVPVIDPIACNGCDACIRICPHQSLVLEQEPVVRYAIDPIPCSGCGMCSDVCEKDAIKVHEMLRPEQYEVVLTDHNCQSCGVAFHHPRVQESVNLCPICRHRDHQRLLYQVLEE
jgi:Pyruvate/2-oxoacid:ferredoxin oxidoreductase delta subunit